MDAHERENETDVARTTATRLAAYERRYRKLLDELTKIGYIRSGSLAPREPFWISMSAVPSRDK